MALPGTYTYGQIETLWVQNGGSASAAPIAAAIAMAESGGHTSSLNNNPATGDYSVGLWQVNYFDGLLPSRSAKYGPPSELQGNPDLQAKAAIDISNNGQNWQPWSTFSSGAYKKYLSNNTYVIPTEGGLYPQTDILPAARLDTGEGDLFSAFGLTLKRETVRKILGGAVLVGGGFVVLAGVFRLSGWKPKQVSAEQLNRPLLVPVREPAEPAEPPTTDELAERRRNRSRARRERSAEDETLSARAAGEEAARAAGDF